MEKPDDIEVAAPASSQTCRIFLLLLPCLSQRKVCNSWSHAALRWVRTHLSLCLCLVAQYPGLVVCSFERSSAFWVLCLPSFHVHSSPFNCVSFDYLSTLQSQIHFVQLYSNSHDSLSDSPVRFFLLGAGHRLNASYQISTKGSFALLSDCFPLYLATEAPDLAYIRESMMGAHCIRASTNHYILFVLQ